MKVELIPTVTLQVKVDGKLVQGTFVLESEWSGMMRLRCTGPCATIIIKKPETARYSFWENFFEIFKPEEQGEKQSKLKPPVLEAVVIESSRLFSGSDPSKTIVP